MSAAFLAGACNVIVALKSELSGRMIKEVNVPETLHARAELLDGFPPSQTLSLVGTALSMDSTVWLQGKLNYLELIKRLLGYLIIIMARS